MMNKAVISLTFDDGLLCQFERGVPVLDSMVFRPPSLLEEMAGRP
jgi:hypothetical protein